MQSKSNSKDCANSLSFIDLCTVFTLHTEQPLSNIEWQKTTHHTVCTATEKKSCPTPKTGLQCTKHLKNPLALPNSSITDILYKETELKKSYTFHYLAPEKKRLKICKSRNQKSQSFNYLTSYKFFFFKFLILLNKIFFLIKG